MKKYPLITTGIAIFIAGVCALVILTGNDRSTTETTTVDIAEGDNIIRAHALLPGFDLNDLVHGDTVVVIGKVDRIAGSDWNQEVTHGPMIHTNVIVSVDQYIAGKLAFDELAVRIPGGRIDRDVMVMDVAPIFSVGEQVLLFLYAPQYDMEPVPDRFSSDSYFMVANYGKFELNGDRAVCAQSERTFNLDYLIDMVQQARQ